MNKNEFLAIVTVSKEFREPTCFDMRLNIQSGTTKPPAR